MKKVLITGALGFVGQYLVDYLINIDNLEVHALVNDNRQNSKEFLVKTEKVKYHFCNINNKEKTKKILGLVKPDYIFHLAAQSYVSSSWEKPELTLHTNIIGQSNILEGVQQLRDKKFDPKIIITASSEEYGPVFDEEKIPLGESAELRPQSPYAVSKIAQDFMGFQYWQSYGLNIIRLRAFNHTGPRRDPVFGIANFARQIALIEKQKTKPEIRIRDLSAVRDFTDVRDVVRAYWLATESCEPGSVYNVCSAKGISFKEILDKLISLSERNNITLSNDPSGRRPTDGGMIVGDNTKFCKVTGWQPEIDFLNQTLFDILEYWRKII